MGRHPELDTVRELVAFEDDVGQPLVVQVDRPLHPANQRLMDSLGVEVRVVSQLMTTGRYRTYPRRFDHDEARARHAAGESIAALAREYNVTWKSVARAVDERQRARLDARARQKTMSGRCVDCGTSCTLRAGTRCVRCSALARATSARPGELQCVRCREWKPDDAFPHNRIEPARRGRHGLCRGCGTIVRQECREKRKVPCVKCGAPRLPKSEIGARGRDTGLCRSCYQASRRAA